MASGYRPASLETLAAAAGLLAAILLAGRLLSGFPGRGARLLAWTLALAGTAGMERLAAGEPAGIRMLLVIGALLYGMKAIVLVEGRMAGEAALPLRAWFAFTVLWFGMRPGLFLDLGAPARPDAAEHRNRGVLHLAFGTLLVGGAAATWHLGRPALSTDVARAAATLLLLPGLSLALHFGVFNLATAAWRRAGVDARPLFRAPLLARSLGEFWGKRWNLAFSEMTAAAVYRPIAGSWGRPAGLVAAFACSGLLHEVAISVPGLRGLGLPSLYFLLHGLLVLFERALQRRGRGPETWGAGGRAWTLAWLALPAPILFHVPFLRGCIWPLIGMS